MCLRAVTALWGSFTLRNNRGTNKTTGNPRTGPKADLPDPAGRWLAFRGLAGLSSSRQGASATAPRPLRADDAVADPVTHLENYPDSRRGPILHPQGIVENGIPVFHGPRVTGVGKRAGVVGGNAMPDVFISGGLWGLAAVGHNWGPQHGKSMSWFQGF